MVPSPTDDPAIQHVVVNKFKFIGGQAIYKECQRTVAYQAYEYMATEFGETVDVSQQFKIMYQLYHFGRPCAEAGGKVYREIQDPVPYKQMFLEGLGPYKFLFNRDAIPNVTDPESPSNRNIQSLILSIRPEFHRKDGMYIQVRDQLLPAVGSTKPQAQHINWDLMSRKAFSNKANVLGQPLLDMAKLAAKNVKKMASIILSSNSPYKKSAESGEFDSGKNWDDYVSWVLKEARKELVDDTEELSVLVDGEVENDKEDWIFPGFGLSFFGVQFHLSEIPRTILSLLSGNRTQVATQYKRKKQEGHQFGSVGLKKRHTLEKTHHLLQRGVWLLAGVMW